MSVPRILRRVVLSAVVAAAVFLVPAAAMATDAAQPRRATEETSASAPTETWAWPLATFRLERPYIAPAHEYAPGHRGIDLASPVGAAEVRAPAAGVVAFVGPVAGREIVTIDHGGGLVTTLEPVVSDLVPGMAVERGDAVGVIAVGGHARAGTVHFGVRLGGEYINPMLLLEGVPRAVLLPCC